MRHVGRATVPSTARSHPAGSPGRSRSRSRVPTGNLTGVTLTTVVEPSRSGRSSIRRLRVMTTSEPSGRQHAAGDHAQAVAERAACRQPQQLGRDHRPGDAEQPRDLLRRAVDAGAVVLDEVAAVSAVDRRWTLAPVSSALSASSFSTRRRSLPAGTPAFCCSPSTVRKRVQSARSNFKFWLAVGLLNGHRNLKVESRRDGGEFGP